ncbi:hypothetical protein RB601_009209 [Gaeumannomyces tritici]
MQAFSTFCLDVDSRTRIRELYITDKYVVAPGSHTVVHSFACLQCQQTPAGEACPNNHAVIKTGPIWDSACHPTSNLMLTASFEGKIVLWDLTTGAYIRGFSHEQNAHKVVFLDGSSTFASASRGGDIMLWTSTAGEPTDVLRAYAGGSIAMLLKLDNGSDGNFLAASYGDGAVRIWDLATKTCARVLAGHAEGINILSLAPGPDSHRLRVGRLGVLRIWDWKTGTLIAHLEDAECRANEQLFDDVGGSGLMLTYGLPGNVHAWTQDGVRVGAAHAAHDAPLRTLVRLDDRLVVSVGTKDGRVKVWRWGPGRADGERKRWLFDLFSGTWMVRTVVAASGRLAIATQEKDSGLHHVRIWDLEAVRAFAASHIDKET